jgi:DNA-binding IclR family transcriptional regulator
LTALAGIPKPTVSRITATLVAAGFLRNFDILARAGPFLIELAGRTSRTARCATGSRRWRCVSTIAQEIGGTPGLRRENQSRLQRACGLRRHALPRVIFIL